MVFLISNIFNFNLRISVSSKPKGAEDYYSSQNVCDYVSDIVFHLDIQLYIKSLNNPFEKITGWPIEHWLGKSFLEWVSSISRAKIKCFLEQVIDIAKNSPKVPPDSSHLLTVSESLRQKTHTTFSFFNHISHEYLSGHMVCFPWYEKSKLKGVIGVVKTSNWAHYNQSNENLQAKMVQAQRLESVALLAGGIAHDFNNTLTTILGYCDVAHMELPDSSPVRGYIETIQAAGEKAAALTRQLLAFGCKQELSLESVSLNDLLEKIYQMIISALAKDIDVKLDLYPQLPLVHVDTMQLEQTVINLFLNAKDALTNGGQIIIRTFPAKLDGQVLVGLSVKDNGMGMSQATQQRIFEPFYTTKSQSKGSGLGLSSVFGFINQINGKIDVESELGEGSVFSLYLPITEPKESLKNYHHKHPQENNYILVVDDDAHVGQWITQVLTPLGYFIEYVKNAHEAWYTLLQRKEKVDLVITDWRMPGMDGVNLIQKIKRYQPSIATILMSGLNLSAILEVLDEPIAHWLQVNLKENLSFIQKPMQSSALIDCVKLSLSSCQTNVYYDIIND